MDIQLTNQSGNKQSDNIVIDTEKEALTSNTTTANAVVAEQMEQEAGIIPITIEDNALDNKNPAGIASSVFNLGNTEDFGDLCDCNPHEDWVRLARIWERIKEEMGCPSDLS
eukprot:345663_1